jgi:hypothetical protein
MFGLEFTDQGRELVGERRAQKELRKQDDARSARSARSGRSTHGTISTRNSLSASSTEKPASIFATLKMGKDNAISKSKNVVIAGLKSLKDDGSSYRSDSMSIRTASASNDSSILSEKRESNLPIPRGGNHCFDDPGARSEISTDRSSNGRLSKGRYLSLTRISRITDHV